MWRGGKAFLLCMVIAAGILNYADRQIIAVLKPMLQQQLHWSDIDYGNLTSIFQFSSAVALLFAGALVDRIGWRQANPLAVGSWSLAAMAHAFAQNSFQFGAARLSLGATEALATPTAIKTIAATFSVQERSFAIGVMNAANGVGAILTPLILPVLALAVGWQGGFLVVGGLGLVWVGVWRIWRPDHRVAAQGAPETALSDADKPSWGKTLTDRRTWAIALAKIMSDQVWWLLLFWAPDLFHRVYHLSMTGFGLPLALMYCGASVGSLAAGRISQLMLRGGVSLDHTRKISLLVLSLLTLPLSLAPHVGNYWIATAILALTLAAHQGYSTNVFALCTDIIPRANVATVISFAAFCGNMAGMLILQAAARMLGAGWGYGPLLAYASVSYLVGLVAIQVLAPRLQPIHT